MGRVTFAFRQLVISFFNKYPAKRNTRPNHAVTELTRTKRMAPCSVGIPADARPLTQSQNATHRKVLALFTSTNTSVGPIFFDRHRTVTPLVDVNGFRPIQFLLL